MTAVRRRLGPFGASAAMAVAVQGLLLAVDHTPRFFFGDSYVYLVTDHPVFMPRDRSWAYGVVINPVIDRAGSLQGVLLLQTLAGVLACALAGLVLESLFGASRRTSLIVTAALSIEPLLLYYERSILTEVPGLAAWMILAAALAALAARPHWALSVVGAGAAVAMIALRSAFLVAVGVAVLVAAAIALSHLRRGGWRQALVVALLPGLMVIGLFTYAHVTGRFTRSPPSLNPSDGYFLVGMTAPILEPEDFAGLGIDDPGEMLEESRADERSRREAQVYAPDGIMKTIEAQFGHAEANEVASTAARRALRRDPTGFAFLAVRQAVEYADPNQSSRLFDVWTGLDQPLSPELLPLFQERIGRVIPADAPSQDSAVLSWLRATMWWPALAYVLAVSVSLASLVLGRRRGGPNAGPLRVLAVLTLGYLAGASAGSVAVIPRYILPAIPLLAVQIAVLARGQRDTVATAPTLRDEAMTRPGARQGEATHHDRGARTP